METGTNPKIFKNKIVIFYYILDNEKLTGKKIEELGESKTNVLAV